LIVWQKAHEFVLGVYQYTGHFPKSELFCLTSGLEDVSRLLGAYAKEITRGTKR